MSAPKRCVAIMQLRLRQPARKLKSADYPCLRTSCVLRKVARGHRRDSIRVAIDSLLSNTECLNTRRCSIFQDRAARLYINRLLSVFGKSGLFSLLKLTTETVPVESGWTERYYCWWQEHLQAQHASKLFSVRLVGDETSPEQFTSLALNDLAHCRHVCLCNCSTW